MKHVFSVLVASLAIHIVLFPQFGDSSAARHAAEVTGTEAHTPTVVSATRIQHLTASTFGSLAGSGLSLSGPQTFDFPPLVWIGAEVPSIFCVAHLKDRAPPSLF